MLPTITLVLVVVTSMSPNILCIETSISKAASSVQLHSIESKAVAVPPIVLVLLLQFPLMFIYFVKRNSSFPSKTTCKQPRLANNDISPPRLNLRQIKKAEREYEKRMRKGEIDFRVLVATGVQILTAREKIDEGKYSFEIEFEGDPSGYKATGDLFVSREMDGPYNIAVCNVIAKFVEFNDENGDIFSSSSKEYVVFDGRIRHPSLTIFPHLSGRETMDSALLLEVEFEPRSLHAMNSYCLHYFRTPCVRAVLLFKYFPQHAADRRFAAVAVLYRRGPRGAPEVADAVSFGTGASYIL
jgi:hypothetical protein